MVLPRRRIVERAGEVEVRFGWVKAEVGVHPWSGQEEKEWERRTRLRMESSTRGTPAR